MSDAETDAARNQEQYFKEHPEESDELINTVDSKVWANEFCRATGFKNIAWAQSWFTNAIASGILAGTRIATKNQDKPELEAKL